ncbi:hypothetical protein Fmac_019581 [Flemingia macrophylla]|uniref:Uncharacterized protein n=1 Tax=Flemingia macrophylla TaxID=520843 RepID=A0ABD1MA57_9FABA
MPSHSCILHHCCLSRPLTFSRNSSTDVNITEHGVELAKNPDDDEDNLRIKALGMTPSPPLPHSVHYSLAH